MLIVVAVPNIRPFDYDPPSRGHQRDSPALDRDRIFEGVITLLAFKRVHIKARLAGFNAGKFHRFVALGTRENAGISDAE
jgi:hypothetical protein